MIGIDEVGRGAWAGPLLVCAARMRHPVIGLRDSKKLTKTRRELLARQIKEQADIGFGWVSAAEIDEHGLAFALRSAALRAVTAIRPQPNESIVIDGTINLLPDTYGATTMVKADDSVPEVSAASIVAKVARDAYMAQLAQTYTSYGFDAHVGYGTLRHRRAIVDNGLTPEHRKSFRMRLT